MMEFLLGKGVDINDRSWKIKQKVPYRTTAGTALMSAVKKQTASKMVTKSWGNLNIADDGG